MAKRKAEYIERGGKEPPNPPPMPEAMSAPPEPPPAEPGLSRAEERALRTLAQMIEALAENGYSVVPSKVFPTSDTDRHEAVIDAFLYQVKNAGTSGSPRISLTLEDARSIAAEIVYQRRMF